MDEGGMALAGLSRASGVPGLEVDQLMGGRRVKTQQTGGDDLGQQSGRAPQ